MEKVTINKIERLKVSDSKGLTSRDINRKFGKTNDYIELHIHDLGGELLETTPNYQGYSLPDQIESNTSQLTSTLFIDPYQHLDDKGYKTGTYNVACNVHRKKIFSGLQADFKIHEISPSRTELKLKGLGVDENRVKKAILSFISEIETSLFNKDFILNFGNNINILGINVAYHNTDGCALIKLYEPLPPNIEIGAEFWVVEEIIEPLEFKVDLGETPIEEGGIPLRGPNFRIDTRLNDSIPSQFKVYNDFLENTHSASLYNVLSHLSESIELSIDYTQTGTGSLETGFHFENFTHFGSAEERLKNFKYKLELLELYQRQIDEINTIQGSVSASAAITTNISLIETKKAKLISGLDNYEKFLYYENHPFAWPKVPDFGIGNLQVTGSALLDESYWLQVGLTDCDVFFKPYNLRPTTSSQAKEWYGNTNELNIDYGGQILSASRFDRDNKHNLVRTIPEHISMREENVQYLTFTNMIGHYFDQIWIYIDHIGQIRNAHNSFKDGISKDLVYTALSSLGVEAFDQFENEELFEYIIGTNKTKSGSFGTYDAPDGTTMITSSLVTCDNGGGSMPKGDITKEIWKRLYHNLPYLLKTKGTERGIKALMNCYGVPETILNVKEYGGPTTDSTTYKTFNYEKFSRALAGSSDTEGYFIKAPWASSSSLFTGTIESRPNRSEGKIIFSIGAVKDLFNAPFPKTVELTATDLSVHTFTSNYDFLLHGESGLETAQSLAGAIDAHTLFSASVFVREDLYDPAHEKYNLDIEIMITQHLQGIDGNTEIKGTLFEDTLTPACGNPQQFPEVEFLTKVDFNAGGGINNSTTVTTVIPGINTCSSKVLIENGITADGSGNLINNGLFQDDAEFMDFVTNVTNGYTNTDISLYSFESLTPSAIPLYLGEFQCKGINDYGLFVIECFKADDCVNIQSVVTPTTFSPGTTAVGTITIPNNVGQNNGQYDGETVILTSADGTAHTFTLTGGGSVNSIGQDLMNAINADPNFTAINLDSVPQRTGYSLEIITIATGSSTNNPIQGSALNMSGDVAIMSLITNGLTGGTDSTGGEAVLPPSNSTCNAILDFYIDGINLSFNVTTVQFTDYIVQGTTGDSTYDSYLTQAIPYAASTHIYDGSAYVTSDGNSYNYGPTNSDYVFSHPTNQVFVTSTSIQAADKQGYLDPSEILNYCNRACGNVSSIKDACYTNYTTFINALNAQGIINVSIPGVNVDTKWSELKAADIITHFPASSSCGCDNYEIGNITTKNTLTQQPTVNTSIPLGQGAQNDNYGKNGVKFYSDTITTNSYNISQNNKYFGGSNINDGRLNNIGVWDGTNPWTGGTTIMNPINQWIGFSKCITVKNAGEYLIGLAGDDRIRLAINGEMLIEKDTNSADNYNYWWVYKVFLEAGNNTIVLEGKNDDDDASFGCDIVGPFPTGTFNSETDFHDIDNNGITLNGISYNDLEDLYKNNIVFSSQDELSTSTLGGEIFAGSFYGDPDTDTGVTDEASNYVDPERGGIPQLDWFIANDPTVQFNFRKFAYSHPDYLTATVSTSLSSYTPCFESQNQPTRLDANGDSTYWHTLQTIIISSKGWPPTLTTGFIMPNSFGGHQSYNTGDGLYYSDLGVYNSWESFINALNAVEGPEQFLTSMTRAEVESKIKNAEQSLINSQSFLDIHNQLITAPYDIQIKIATTVSHVICTQGTGSGTDTGGEFNTQTNQCPEGYLYNECTKLCEKTEITTTGENGCGGMVFNSNSCDDKIDTNHSGLSFTSHIYGIAANPDYHNVEFNTLKWSLGGGNNQLIPLPAACVQDEGPHYAYIKYVTYSGLGNVQYTSWSSFIDAINALGYSFQYGNEVNETNFGWQDLEEELGASELTCVWDWCGCGDSDGSFATSAEFVDYFTDFDNGFYGQNIDDYYFESDEPLPWGTFVEDQCTGSNGLPIRRVVGFKKDSSILPIDNTLYINYQTFINQLNVDGHGVSETANFTNLTSELITGSFEGSCQHKTLISNPQTSDGSFPTPGSGNTGMVDFLEYYSEQGNNIQDIAVDGFKFSVDPDTLTQTFQETCPLDATIYCFYDGTSMSAEVFTNVIETIENWVADQGTDFTGTIYHMVNSYERWLDCARLPFTNIGDHLLNGGFGSISTIYSHNDPIRLNSDINTTYTPQTNTITSGEKAFNGSHNWYKLAKNGTGNTRSKQIVKNIENGGLVTIQGQSVTLKSVINDGNGLYDDEVPNKADNYEGVNWNWRGPAPSLQNATDKALVFNFYDESSETSSSGKRQYHQSSNKTTPDFSDVGLTQAKIELGGSQGQKDWRSDYELFIKTYFENIDRTATNYKDQGDLINFMYPSAPIGLIANGSSVIQGVDGVTAFHKTMLAFPLHAWGSILTGSATNPGMLDTGHEYLETAPPANNAIYLTALDSNGGANSNPYAEATWANETGLGTPSGYDPTYGYGGLQNYGWVVTSEAVKENAFTSFEFENALEKVLNDTLCSDFTVQEFTDPNICLDVNGNMLFTINEFFMDPNINSTPFTKYTDYITEGQNAGKVITLADTRLESQIGGPISVDECICADVCPNDLVLNNNTIITLTGSLFDQYNSPFTIGQSITQANNNGFSATVESLDSDSNAIIINITSGTLTFSDPLVDVGTGAQYIPDPQTGEFIISQPQGVFTNYDEYMNFISDPVNGYNTTNLNTLKFQLVDQSFQEITTEEEDCSINADIYVYYDHTSMGDQAIQDAFISVNNWVLDLQTTQGYNKTVYHIFARDERWVKWGTGTLEGFTDQNKYHPLNYNTEPYLISASNDPGNFPVPGGIYSGTYPASSPLSSVGPATEDVLTICYLDESDNEYVNYENSSASPYNPQFSSNINAAFQVDRNDYVSAYNQFNGGNVANFFYPTPNLYRTTGGDLTAHYTQTILEALASITSGDNDTGLLANPPSTPNMQSTGDTSLGSPWTGHAFYNILKTSNPYFNQGFGELDKYGWGLNVTFPAMSSTQLAIDLNEFVSTSDLCITETVQEVEINVLCTGSTSTDTNQYGLYTVEGFYQNALIEPSSTINEYSTDLTLYGNWNDFITQKIQEDGATGINFLNNNGANININTTWDDLSNSVATSGTTTTTTTTTIAGPTINVFTIGNPYTSTFNNSSLNSGITGNPTQQLNWLISEGHGQNIDGWYFDNDTLNSASNANGCCCDNLPPGGNPNGHSGGVYSTVEDFTFTCIGEQAFSSVAGTYQSWHTFIDTINQLNYISVPGTTTTGFNAGSACEGSTDTGISGSAYTSSLTYNIQYCVNNGGATYTGNVFPGNTIEENYIDYVAANDPTNDFSNYYFEDTGYNVGTCSSYSKYGTGFTIQCLSSTSSTNAAAGFFGNLMVSGTNSSLEYTSWTSFINALNVSENINNKGANPFSVTNTLLQVLDKMDGFWRNYDTGTEQPTVEYRLDFGVDSCECSTTTGPSTSVQQDIFTYQDDVTNILTYFNSTSEINYSAAFIVNTSEASCEDIPGPTIDVEDTQSISGNISLYGQIDGGACVCIPETTGGESLDGDIEFESCICCPESSSISVGCLVAGEVSSSRCECSADTYETIINFVSASSFEIIPSSSAKMVEFRIKPHRLDKPEYTSLEACCDPIVTVPTASHLFSLYNEHHPEVTPHLVLRPYTGSDVSSSDDFKNFGSLDLYKKGLIVGSTDIFPVYNGNFWNIFIGTKGESGSNSEVYFGAYQSNFLGHVTHLTASATFSEYERALSFGDTAYNLANRILPAETAYFCGVPTNTNSVSGSVNTFKYSGSLQEIKYHIKDFLTHDTLTKHALDPFQYAGNTVSSSWNNVYLRLPLGSNNKVDSASYNNNGLGIIQNFNPHPSFSLYESSSISSSITGQSFSEVYETHRHLTPDTVGISTTSEKVRIDSGSVDRSILSFDIKSETSTLDRQPLDYNDLGVFFSPQAEINEDIVYTLGAFRMDDYIGDPTHQSLAEYPDLENLKLEYFQKYLNSHRQNMFDYIRLIQFIDHTLFKVVEQFVPAKANLKTGLLIEPHYLERQKFARQIPTFERLERDAEFDPYLNLEGEVKHYEACINISDKTNENYYTWEGALTASDNLYMSQSKYASDECNPYITLYDNFDPLYGNYVDCIISKEYYYVSKPPQFYQNDPVNEGIDPRITINPPSPSKPSGYGGREVIQTRLVSQQGTQQAATKSTNGNTNGNGEESGGY